jgi:hypothetical protein
MLSPALKNTSDKIQCAYVSAWHRWPRKSSLVVLDLTPYLGSQAAVAEGMDLSMSIVWLSIPIRENMCPYPKKWVLPKQNLEITSPRHSAKKTRQDTDNSTNLRFINIELPENHKCSPSYM